MYLTIREVADHARVSTRTVQAWIHDKRLPARRFGPKVVRIDAADLAALGEVI